MNGLPYYKAYPRDFLEGTAGLPFEVKAAFRLVLDLIYMHGGNLPDDRRYISGQLGCSVRKWSGIRLALIEAGKITVENDIISNFRADNLMIISRKYQDKQRENRSRSNKINDLQSPSFDHRANKESEPDTYINTPKPPSGGFHDKVEHTPVNFRTMFADSVETAGVECVDGTVRLVNGVKQFWLDEFGGDEKRLDLALRQITIQPLGRMPLRQQVERQLARQVADRYDRDQRYQSAVKSSKQPARPVKPSRW